MSRQALWKKQWDEKTEKKPGFPKTAGPASASSSPLNATQVAPAGGPLEGRGGQRPAKASSCRKRRLSDSTPKGPKVIFSHCHAVTLDQCRAFKDLDLMEASFWAEPVRAVFQVEGMHMKGGEL